MGLLYIIFKSCIRWGRENKIVLARSQNCWKRLSASSRLSARNISARTGQIFMKFWYLTIFRKSVEKIQVKKVNWSRYRHGVAQRVGRGIALLFHDRSTRRGWVVSSTSRPHFTSRKDPVSFYRRLDRSQGHSGRAENLVPTAKPLLLWKSNKCHILWERERERERTCVCVCVCVA